MEKEDKSNEAATPSQKAVEHSWDFFWGDVSKANESIKTTVQCSGMQFFAYAVYSIHTSLTTHHSTKG